MNTNKFNWRPIQESPRDGSKFVALRIVTHVGGTYRPIDLDPEMLFLHRKSADANSRGYLYLGDDKHGGSIGDFSGFWTSLDEYKAAIPTESWRDAPKDNLLGGTGPLVFVRPVESSYASYQERSPMLEARVVWHNGPDHGWSDVRIEGYSRAVSPEFLDGRNGDLPFRWCLLRDFFPTQAFDTMAQMARNVFESKMRDITRWRGE